MKLQENVYINICDSYTKGGSFKDKCIRVIAPFLSILFGGQGAGSQQIYSGDHSILVCIKQLNLSNKKSWRSKHMLCESTPLFISSLLCLYNPGFQGDDCTPRGYYCVDVIFLGV